MSSQLVQLNRSGMAVANEKTITILQSTGKRDFDVAEYNNVRSVQLRLGRTLAADPIKAHAREVAEEKKKAKLTGFYEPVRTLTEITTFECCHSKCMQVHFSFYSLNVLLCVLLLCTYHICGLLYNFFFFSAEIRPDENCQLEACPSLENAGGQEGANGVFTERILFAVAKRNIKSVL